MKIASPYAVAAGLLLAGVFVARAAIGVPAARAYSRGRGLEHSGTYLEAGRLLDRGAIGGNLSAGLARSGWTRVETWRELPSEKHYGPEGAVLLRDATSRYLKARAASPASAWVTARLGDVYLRRERTARAERTVSLDIIARGPWAMIGDDGRIAIGLTRAAIDHEPARADHRDQMVFVLDELGLREEALLAMEDAARALPDFREHPDFEVESLRPELAEAFWRTARAVSPGEAPLLSRDQQLLAAGQLGRRLGHLAEAEDDLRSALASNSTPAGLAEIAFHLALVLMDSGKLDEAERMLARAAQDPVFGPGVAQIRARIAETQGRFADALEQLREARRLQPRDLSVLLAFARLAQKNALWDQAEEALQWSIVVHPDEPAARRALVEMYLARGDRPSARNAFDDFTRLFGTTEDTARLEQALSAKLDPRAR